MRMTAIPIRHAMLAVLLISPLPLSGCLRGAPAYEETYRLFFAKESFANLDPSESPDVIAQRFAPTAGVNRSINDLAESGYVLYQIEPLPGREGPTLLRFRRKIPSGELVTHAPPEFMGVYEVQDADPPTFYVLAPWKYGYDIHVMHPAGQEKIIRTKWDGYRLNWHDGEVDHALELSGDARIITETTQSMNLKEPARPIAIVEARRLTGKQ